MGRAGLVITTALLLLAAAPGVSRAECSTAVTGARCVTPGVSSREEGAEVGRRVPARRIAPAFAPGDVLPQGRYFRLLNSQYYGLPPARDGWRYYEVEGRVLRVRPDTLEVIGDATNETNRAF